MREKTSVTKVFAKHSKQETLEGSCPQSFHPQGRIGLRRSLSTNRFRLRSTIPHCRSCLGIPFRNPHCIHVPQVVPVVVLPSVILLRNLDFSAAELNLSSPQSPIATMPDDCLRRPAPPVPA